MATALHPYLSAVADPFTRLARACFWQAADPDWRHSAYWRDQVEQCRVQFIESFRPQASWPADALERRQRLHREQVAVAFRTGYELANKRRVLSVGVPGFESGSVCNTRTLCHGWQFSGAETPRTLSHGGDFSGAETPRTLCNGLQSGLLK